MVTGLKFLEHERGFEMTVTKEHLVDSILKIVDSRKKAVQVVETLLETTRQSLESGEEVLLSGFGKFSVRDKKERRGRNPQTGNDLILDARRVVTFKSSGVFIEKLNNGKGEI
jgi:integration host factor subunit alpha